MHLAVLLNLMTLGVIVYLGKCKELTQWLHPDECNSTSDMPLESSDENTNNCTESAFCDFLKDNAVDLFVAVIVIITGVFIIVTIICRTKHRRNSESQREESSSVLSVPAMKSSTLLQDGSIRFFEVTEGNEFAERENTFL